MNKSLLSINIALLCGIAGCSSGGSTSGGTAPAQPVSLASTGGLAATTNGGVTTFSSQRDSATSTTVTVGDKTYQVSTNPNTVPGIQSSASGDFVYAPSGSVDISSGSFVDTSLFVKGSDLTNPAGSGRVTDVGAAINGTLTPVENLPSVAFYRGEWNAVATDGPTAGAVGLGQIGNFSATADFGSRQDVSGTFRDDSGQTVLRLDADITGNEFAGTFSDTSNNEVSSVNGGFFGPNAEEIAGVSAARDGDDAIAVGFIGSR